MHATYNIVTASSLKRWTGASGFPKKDAASEEQGISIKRKLSDKLYITFNTTEKLRLQLNAEEKILS